MSSCATWVPRRREWFSSCTQPHNGASGAGFLPLSVAITGQREWALFRKLITLFYVKRAHSFTVLIWIAQECSHLWLKECYWLSNLKGSSKSRPITCPPLFKFSLCKHVLFLSQFNVRGPYMCECHETGGRSSSSSSSATEDVSKYMAQK